MNLMEIWDKLVCNVRGRVCVSTAGGSLAGFRWSQAGPVIMLTD